MKNQILALGLLPAICFAEVSMQTASYIRSENDFQTSVLSRTYNSRSLWFGVFGFGWCAEFEKQIDPKTKAIQHCDRNLQIAVKMKNNEWIARYPNGIQETYTFRGQLMKIMDRSGTSWSLTYDSQGRLSRILSFRKRYDLIYQSQRLIRIDPQRGPPVFYQRSGHLLIESRSPSKFSKYQYDDLMNLTQIESSFESRIQIDYNSESDQVRKIQIGPCRQEFSFQKTTNTQFQSTAITRCPSQTSRTQIFTFKAHPKRKALIRVATEEQ